MEEEKEFSFGYFMRYSVRRWFVILLCMILGAIAGSLYVISYKVTNYEAWEMSVRFDKSAYFDRVSNGESKLEAGDYNKYKDKETAAYKLLFSEEPRLKMEVFNLVKDDPNFYPKLDDELEKMNKFFSDFMISERTDTLVVTFCYDVKNDEKTGERREMVQKAVKKYVELAIGRVKTDSVLAADTAFADTVIKTEDVCLTFVDSDENKTFASNKRPSLATTIIIGVIAGFVVAMVIVLVRYAVDKRVKSVKDLLPSDKSETVVAGEDYTDAYVSLAAKLNASGVKKPLVASVVKDDFTRRFATGFAEYCHSAGLDVKLVLFGENDTDWHEYFASGEKSADDTALYVYDGADNSIIEYISVYADGVCLLLNQAAANKKHFLEAVESRKNAKYVCTVVYNISESWLD